MFNSRTKITMASLAIIFLSVILNLYATSVHALASVSTNDKQSLLVNNKKVHFSIKGGNVVLKSLVGDISIPIPENFQKELKEQKQAIANQTHKRVVRAIGFRPDPNINYNTWAFSDFFECNEQAQIVLSSYSENHRYWEAFFKRNSINDTLAVRYCCNLLEYVDNAEESLSPDCRDQVRLQDHVMIKKEIRYTCRQYEFYNVQCFLVRWMYWWIPLLIILLIALGIFLGCSSVARRSNKSQIRHDDVKILKEAKVQPTYDDHNSNTLPYRPAYSSPSKPVTNKAYMHY